MRKVFFPVELVFNHCYDGLPVVQANEDLTISRQSVYFLGPHDRILSDSSSKLPCSEYFGLKFKTIDGQWIAQTFNGVVPTKITQPELNWLDLD